MEGPVEIGLSVNGKETVISAEGLNEDGESIISQVDVTGMHYQEALQAIMETDSYQECQGDKAKVKVSCHDDEQEADMQQSANEACHSYGQQYREHHSREHDTETEATEKNTAARAMENTMRNPGVTSRKRVRKISRAVILPATQTMKIQNTGIETGITENKHSMTGHKNITTKNGISHYGYAVFSSISFCLLASAASFSCSHPCNCGKIEKNQRNGGIIICL